MLRQPMIGSKAPARGKKMGDARPPRKVRTAKAFPRPCPNQMVITVKVTG
ncbi:hypothetical protein KTT_23030 [Tengunoibacter tsumagoiensis]|uniref:Uncharacterized protein n=1 Tax=Tengunoibacter tsumagoiensis TaxID=2014871 RepID=A0A402A010_9CHLR|nr:hypothetical protein KTT_23030 [Tengunoibacter tsumagoiensis]